MCASFVCTLSAQLIPGDQEHAPAVAVSAGSMPTHLKVPYIVTEHVIPVVTTDEEVKIGFFVTDWDNSFVRFGDESFCALM